MAAIEAMQQVLTPEQVAERLRAYHATMEPWIKQSTKFMAMLMPASVIHPDGRLETVYSEKDQAIIDGLRRQLQEISAHTLKSLGLATPPGDG